MSCGLFLFLLLGSLSLSLVSFLPPSLIVCEKFHPPPLQEMKTTSHAPTMKGVPHATLEFLFRESPQCLSSECLPETSSSGDGLASLSFFLPYSHSSIFPGRRCCSSQLVLFQVHGYSLLSMLHCLKMFVQTLSKW